MAERHRGVEEGAGIPWAGAGLQDKGSWEQGVQGFIECRAYREKGGVLGFGA